MSKSISIILVGIAPIVLLVLGAEVHAQANDVVCTRCVDRSDIAREAVTVNKVVPELKNAIGTFCADGEFVVGMDDNGHFVCDTALYFPFGPKKDIPVTELRGWTQCYKSLYNSSTDLVVDVLDECTGSKLLLACRPVGDANLTLLAAGNRTDVLTDTTDDETTTHVANGTGWYFHSPDKSWGFVKAGDTVIKDSCDVDSSGSNAKRLCWHIFAGGNIAQGFLCGTTQTNTADWERLIYDAN